MSNAKPWELEIDLTGERAGTTESVRFSSLASAEDVAAACEAMGYTCRIREVTP